MYSKREQYHKSTDKLIALDSSVDDLYIPPLDLKNKLSRVENNSSSNTTDSDQNHSAEINEKNASIIALADIHSQSVVEKPPPVPIPRRSLTSTFQFNRKDDKNQANDQKKNNEKSQEIDNSTFDESDETQLMVTTKRVRPLSAKPSSKHRLTHKTKKKNRVPEIIVEHESVNAVDMKAWTNDKHIKNIQIAEQSTDRSSNSNESYVEKNEYEMHELKGSEDKGGQNNHAFQYDNDDVNDNDENESESIKETAFVNEPSSSAIVSSNKSHGTIKTEKKVKRNRKKRRQHSQVADDLGSKSSVNESNQSNKADTMPPIIEIILHETSPLTFNYLIRRPRIKVSIYDINTEDLLIKSNPLRNAVVNYEPVNIDFIQPIISNHCILKDTCHIECQWNNEQLIINEYIRSIQTGSQIIFFELIDILVTDEQRSTAGEDGWYRICWAFLRPGDDVHFSNIDKRNCLQLYRYRKGKSMSLLPIFHQWKSPKEKYPATLTITLKGYVPDLNRSRSFSRPMSVLEEELTGDIYSDNLDNLISNTVVDELSVIAVADSARATSNSVGRKVSVDINHSKLPHGLVYKHRSELKSMKQYHGHMEGCSGGLAICFNPIGDLIAFHTTSTSHDHEIIVLSVPAFKTKEILRGHLNIVYDMDWYNDCTLVSVSSDHTAIVWFIENDHYSFKILPHPTYLYAVQCPRLAKIASIYIATGGRDAFLRIWRVFGNNNDMSAYELVQEHSGHQNYITAIVGSDNGDTLYSSDYSGVIIQWIIEKPESMDRINYQYCRSINTITVGIRNMVIHPSGNRMYIQCVKDARAHCIDLSTGVVIQTLGSNTTNILSDHKHRTQLAISKCGTIVFTSTKHEIIHWNHFHETRAMETSLLANEFNMNELDETTFISSLTIHPRFNSLVACTLYGHGNKLPMIILNNQPSKLSSSQINADDLIENVLENEREAIDRWRQIRQEIFANDEHIGTFDNILERIDDLFNMAVTSPNRTDDYKKNILRKKKENVNKLLLRTQNVLPPTSGTLVTQVDDATNIFKQVLQHSGSRSNEDSNSIHSNNTFVINGSSQPVYKQSDVNRRDSSDLSTQSPTHSGGTYSIESNAHK